MGFDGLLGNEQLKKNLRGSVEQGRISHFYLIAGPAGSGKRTLARLLAAAALCRGEEKPCLGCTACRKVFSGSHPDFITIDEPEKKTVSVELIRRARADIYVRPNEAERKVYLLPRAQEITVEGQNALLKVLEEPPAYGVFVLLTDNPDRLLPTMRSRCVELSLRALPEDILHDALRKEFPEAEAEAVAAAVSRSGGYLGQAKALLASGNALSPQTEGFAQSFADKDDLGLLQTLTAMESWGKDRFLPELEAWIVLLESALTCRYGIPASVPAARRISAARSSSELMGTLMALRKAAEYVQSNVAVATVCGYLTWALR